MDTFWFYSLDLSSRKFIFNTQRNVQYYLKQFHTNLIIENAFKIEYMNRIDYDRQYILHMNDHSENRHFVGIAIFIDMLFARLNKCNAFGNIQILFQITTMYTCIHFYFLIFTTKKY